MKYVAVTLAVLMGSSVYADDKIPSEVKRLQTLRSRKLEDINRQRAHQIQKIDKVFKPQAERVNTTYVEELKKLKGQYSKNSDLEAAVYVDSLLNEMAEEESIQESTGGQFAEVECELEFVRFDGEVFLYPNNPLIRWREIPKEFNKCLISSANHRQLHPLSFTVTHPGIVTVVADGHDPEILELSGWKRVETATWGGEKHYRVCILQRQLEVGSYTLGSKGPSMPIRLLLHKR